jgi:tetratricopeptide (TPR) repeat protein
MKEPSPEMMALFEAGLAYEAAADHYHAIKLYKRIIKQAAYWPEPYLRLGDIYSSRKEWKPALYYNKKAIALAVDNKAAWWNVGIAATALHRPRLARRVWQKFGLSQGNSQPISVKITYQDQFEVLGARRIDVARAVIGSIPHPKSGRKFQDVLLIDNTVKGYHISGYRKLPIYDELDLLKRSTYSTFSCLLSDIVPKDIEVLQQLCTNARLGFELWGNASRSLSSARPSGGLPEYYSASMPPQKEVLIAIAAKQQRQAVDVLESWKIISLKSYHHFQVH